MDLKPIYLQGQHISLEPLNESHLDDIRAAAADGELWKLFFTSVPRPDQVSQWLATALEMQQQQRALPFAVRDNQSGKIIGSTRYCNIEHTHQRVEIGYTWYARSAQRSGVNTECKHLLLRHAFEVWQCIAVEFRTDWFNRRSQAAIERLGAKRDGVLRNHMILPDGRIRDTVVYSILRNEWPGVSQNLQYMRQQYGE
ncbi:GNAT family N-acetyltransferase [Undibacterium rugosum]|uniref:GNAT family N-acetyltransferase n=1 Tax=Undibacterium rugosum TaxID=2762291 RepID=A0A923I687_9BURK|nr:GNAT family protein [Undibacterium rugosum]MBC3936909.1 GNAT family N-acetyltransferase [Undibacterium rugosum]MBR7779425.1 GNAT family N-acetyltransferase [Undibacterium rugosum]